MNVTLSISQNIILNAIAKDVYDEGSKLAFVTNELDKVCKSICDALPFPVSSCKYNCTSDFTIQHFENQTQTHAPIIAIAALALVAAATVMWCKIAAPDQVQPEGSRSDDADEIQETENFSAEKHLRLTADKEIIETNEILATRTRGIRFNYGCI